MNNLIRVAALILTLVLTSACGVKSAYNNADWLIMRWVNDQVSLDEEQERAARAAVETGLAWHCESELPDYVTFLRQIEADVTAGRIDAERIERYGRRVGEFGRRLLSKTRPDLIELLADLDDRQVGELMTGFEERNLELREQAESEGDASAAEDRAEGMIKSMRRLAGKPTDQQRDRLRLWATNLQPTARMSLAHRLQWQSRFEQVLAGRDDRTTFDAAMRNLLQPGALVSEAYERQRERNRTQTIRALADVHALATEDQIRELRENLESLSEKLVELSCS